MPSAATNAQYRAGEAPADRIVVERAGRRLTVRLPRHGAAVAGGLLLLLIGWSVAAAAYMIFHDTVVAELRHGASAAATGYRAQIAALRDELERSRTKGLVERAGLDTRLVALVERQAAVERRQSRLDELARIGGGGVTAAMDGFAPPPAFKPAPADEAALDGGNSLPARPTSAVAAERVASSLDAAEVNQARALEGLALKTSERLRTLERVYDAAQIRRPAAGDGRPRGGPFEPLPAGATAFETRAAEIEADRALVAAFERGLDRAPLRTPAPGAGLSSGFGPRADPFLGRVAFHAGLDFERDTGDDVRATAAGRVTNAGWSGGYGEMVEIDHGGGLSTRFGHLSSVLVRVGDEVKVGALLGRAGSTGRSTGPHLHYETRVNGEAVDPMRFLNAGRILATAR